MFVRDDVQSRVRYISSDALEDGLEGIRTRWHSSKEYEDKEEDIWIKMMAFFPKASEEGRLEVELRACGCAVILTIR